ncbi:MULTISPECIES: hypothetical protein [Mesorhizobium]|uniref:RraA family protein n=1 Tax=Mesorhizobium TaxID=68287 RepID=UPI0010A95776|nr:MULTISPECIES: hypothetical protein [Mesorhizobium]
MLDPPRVVNPVTKARRYFRLQPVFGTHFLCALKLQYSTEMGGRWGATSVSALSELDFRHFRVFITDGLVRDVVGIEAVGLPVYCARIIANSPARDGPGTIGFPVVLGGVTISPGDILIGDRDGVAVVPRLAAETVLARLARRQGGRAGS